MKFLLDTCVISEFVRKSPSKKVIAWLNSKSNDDLYLSVITIGEIQKGISKLPYSQKRLTLQKWLDKDLSNQFDNRVLDISKGIIDRWGRMQGGSESEGKTLPVIDSLIAATAIHHGMTISTRNVSDLELCGASVRNPWE